MIIKPLLELRMQDSDNPDQKEFFRYDVAGAKVWFDQHMKSGHIYAVYVSLPETLEGFQIYVTCDDNKLFYPVDIYAEISHRRFDCGDANQIAEQLIQVKQLIIAIESIFGSGSEHYNLWVDHLIKEQMYENRYH